MNHEIGHVLNLNHPMKKIFDTICNYDPDLCCDTKTFCDPNRCFQPMPPYTNPYTGAQCPVNIAQNTFMDYSINHKSISPCQIQKMRDHLVAHPFYFYYTPNYSYTDISSDDSLRFPDKNELKEVKNVEVKNKKVILYPNPVEGVLNISWAGNESNLDFNVVKIFDIHANCVAVKNIESSEEKIHMRNLNKGIYYLKIENNSHEEIYSTVFYKN